MLYILKFRFIRFDSSVGRTSLTSIHEVVCSNVRTTWRSTFSNLNLIVPVPMGCSPFYPQTKTHKRIAPTPRTKTILILDLFTGERTRTSRDKLTLEWMYFEYNCDVYFMLRDTCFRTEGMTHVWKSTSQANKRESLTVQKLFGNFFSMCTGSLLSWPSPTKQDDTVNIIKM